MSDSRSGRSILLSLLRGLAPALAVLVVSGALWARMGTRFLSAANLSVVGASMAVVTIVAIGATLVIISGGIDLSVGSVVALTGVTAALLMLREDSPWPPWAAALAAIGLGAAVGAVNGALVAWARVPSFIATLGSMLWASGLAQIITDSGQNTSRLPAEFIRVAQDKIAVGAVAIPYPVLYFLGLAIAMQIVLRRTSFGRHVYALGSNEAAARLSGINTAGMKLAIFTISGTLAGVAGVVQAARLGIGQPTTGAQMELEAIAAAVIGGASLGGGVGTIGGTLLGAALIALLRNGLRLGGYQPFWQLFTLGIVIVLAVLYDQLRRRASSHLSP